MRIKLLVLIVICCISLISCNGVFFPKIFFDIVPIKGTPSYALPERIESMEQYPQEFAFWFSQAGNSFKKKFITSIFVKKAYKRLKINKISYMSNYANGTFLENASFQLPQRVVAYDTLPVSGSDYYIEKDGYYWCMLFLQMDKTSTMPVVDFQKIFKNQKSGNGFEMTIIVDYTFDDEEARSVELYYEVYANKNSFMSPFLGM